MKKTPKIKILKIEKFADAKNSGVLCLLFLVLMIFYGKEWGRYSVIHVFHVLKKVDPMQSLHSHTLRQP